MSLSLTLILIVTATAADGQPVGASLDQSIKQLPTRHKIGLVAHSEYSRASNLGPGILSYGRSYAGTCFRSFRALADAARHAAGAQLWRDPMGARYLRLGFLGDNVWKGSPTTQTGRKTYGTAQRFSLVGVG